MGTRGPYATALAAEIKRCRAERFWTQEQLAAALNDHGDGLAITRASISRWESGLRRPAWRHLSALVDVLGVSEDLARRAASERMEAAA